jgi:hypothetical protein
MDTVDVYWEWEGWDDLTHWQMLAQRWRHTVMHHVGFKWAWLNTGPTLSPEALAASKEEAQREKEEAAGKPRVTVFAIEKVVFADEIFARKNGLVRGRNGEVWDEEKDGFRAEGV